MMAPAHKRSYLIAGAMVLAAFFSIVLTPRADETAEVPDLEAMIPKAFGDWMMLNSQVAQVNLVPQGGEDDLFPYDAVLTRAYRHSSGEVMLLAIAYTKNQKQERKIHRPELCYYGQGYSVRRVTGERRNIADQSVYIQRLLARQRSHFEPVTYWMRLGMRTVDGPWDMRVQLLWQGLMGNPTDGLLFRVSTPITSGNEIRRSYVVQDKFIDDLANELPPEKLQILTGHL